MATAKAAPVKKAYDFNAVRPNVKAGNLSDRNRSAYRASSPRSQGTGYGTRPYRDSTGFTGAQARAGYQNRERENQQGGYTQGRGGRPGFSGTRTGFQGRPARPGFQNGRPGFTGGARPGGYGSPAAVSPPKGPAKKSFKGKKQVYRKTDEQLEDDKFFAQKKKAETPANAVPKSIDIMESISVSDLARKMNLKASDIIQKLMSQGMMVTINQPLLQAVLR